MKELNQNGNVEDDLDLFNFTIQAGETLKVAVQVLRQILNTKLLPPLVSGSLWTTMEVDDNGVTLKVGVEVDDNGVTQKVGVEVDDNDDNIHLNRPANHLLASFCTGQCPLISSFSCRDAFCCRLSLHLLSDVLSDFQDSSDINVYMVPGQSYIMFFGEKLPVPLPVDIIEPIQTSFDRRPAPLYSMTMESLTLMETLIAPLMQSSEQPVMKMRFLTHELQILWINTFFTLSELLGHCTIREPEGEVLHEYEVQFSGMLDSRIVEMVSGLAKDVVLQLHTGEQLAWPAFVTFTFSGTRTARVADVGCSKDKGKYVALDIPDSSTNAGESSATCSTNVPTFTLVYFLSNCKDTLIEQVAMYD